MSKSSAHRWTRWSSVAGGVVLPLIAGVAVAGALATSPGCDHSSGGGSGGSGGAGTTSSTTGSTSSSGASSSTGGSGTTSSSTGGSGTGGMGTGGGTGGTGAGDPCVHVCDYGGGTGGADPSCAQGTADCNGDPSDGCETTIAGGDLYNCGACGHVCPGVVNPKNGTPYCAGGGCHFTCAGHFADCNCDGNDGCESDLFTDPQNCGTCGHVCPSGACEQGMCKRTTCPPTDFAAVPAGAWVYSLAIHGPDLYWLEVNYASPPPPPGPQVFAVRKKPLAGGAITTIATSQTVPELEIGQIVADDAAVTLLRGGQVIRIPVAGGPATVLVPTGSNGTFGLAESGGTLFWEHYDIALPAHDILSIPAAGGPVQTFISDDATNAGFVVDASSVYWVSRNSSGAVKKTPVGGGNDVVVGTSFNITAIAANATHLFFTQQGADFPSKMPKAGGPSTFLGQSCGGTGIGTIIAATDSAAYWTTYSPSPGGTLVVSAPAQGGERTVLADEPKAIGQIVADPTGIYYFLVGSGGPRVVCP